MCLRTEPVPLIKRKNFSDNEIKKAYMKSGSIEGLAATLGVSYPTASKWVKSINLELKNQGYNKPKLEINGKQLRKKREALGLSREALCKRCRVSETSLREFELGHSTVRKSNLDKIIDVLKSIDINKKK